MWGIHRWPVNSPHKRLVTRKMFPFDEVMMASFCHNDILDTMKHKQLLLHGNLILLKNISIVEWRDCSAHNTILIVGLTYYVGICLGCGIEYNYLCNNAHVQMHRNTPIPSSIKEMDSSCNASRTSTTLDTVCCIWFVFQIQAGIIFHAIRTQLFILSTHQQYLSYWANVLIVLIHRGWETLIYVSVNWANLGPENGLSPV